MFHMILDGHEGLGLGENGRPIMQWYREIRESRSSLRNK